MKNSTLASIIGIILIILIALVGWKLFFSEQEDSADDTQNGEVITQDFNKQGNLIINNPGFEKDVWYLVYETPGQAAQVKSLVFDNQSVCKIGEKSEKCSAIGAGDRVSVIGVQNESSIVVKTLVVLQKAKTDENTQTPTTTPATTTAKNISVVIYVYNLPKDKLIGGNNNPACSSDASLPLNRTIPATQTPLKDTINLLLAGGNLTPAEKAAGYVTEFPNSGFSLKSAVIDKNGLATLTFEDKNNFSSGGSCRSSILWAQIQKTALQFPAVKSVKFMPEVLFQP